MREVLYGLAFLVIGYFAGLESGVRARTTQALDRGYAESCIGTSVIYWRGECPDPTHAPRP